MEVNLPANWKNLTNEKYDATTYQNKHLDVYITQVSMYTFIGSCEYPLTLWVRSTP